METNIENATAQNNTNADASNNVQNPSVTPPAEAKPAGETKTVEQKTETVSTEDKGQQKIESEPKGDKKDQVINYDLKLPKDSLLDAVALEEISTYAKEKGYTQEQAQDLLNRENDAVLDYQQRQNEALSAKKKEWYDQVIADKEIGGDNYNQNVEYAHRAIKKFMSQEIIDFLDKSGLGNHPELVRGFVRIGKSMQNDTMIKGANSNSGTVSLEEKFYGASIKK